jgi:hypothetical protein
LLQHFSELPGLSETRATPGAKNGETFSPQDCGPASKTRTFTAEPEQSTALLDSRAATLDQNDQHDDSQHAAYDLDRSNAHIGSSFPQ